MFTFFKNKSIPKVAISCAVIICFFISPFIISLLYLKICDFILESINLQSIDSNFDINNIFTIGIYVLLILCPVLFVISIPFVQMAIEMIKNENGKLIKYEGIILAGGVFAVLILGFMVSTINEAILMVFSPTISKNYKEAFFCVEIALIAVFNGGLYQLFRSFQDKAVDYLYNKLQSFLE